MSVPENLIDPAHLAGPGYAPDLAGWYATPLDPAVAQALHAQLRRAEQQALADSRSAYLIRLGLLIAGFWSGRDVVHDHRSLRATTRVEEQALVDLVYGQLLISCKRLGAQALLDQGFAALAGQLPAVAYFTVLKRHELLRQLALTAAGSPARGLADLLVEAKIIKQLKDKGRQGRSFSGSHDDTLG